jgi:membrane-bound serine protease (ClpP class)
MVVSIVLAGAGIWSLSRVLPKTPIYGKLVLQTALSRTQGYVSSDSPKYSQFVGRTGVAVTPLRPAGIAMFADQRLDVVSTGDMIAKGTQVRVVETQGSRVVVEAVSPSEDTTGGDAGPKPA